MKTGESPSVLLMTVARMKDAAENLKHLFGGFTPQRATPIPHA